MYKNKLQNSWKRIVFLGFIFLICLSTLLWDNKTYESISQSFSDTYETISQSFSVTKENLYCFELSGNQLPELNENEPPKGSGIYFHETSCPKNLTDIFLNARQSCSVESALRAHPNTDVFLLISSPVYRRLEETNNILVKQLLSYSNFKIRHISFSQYLSNTPLKVIQESGALNFSLWPIPHSSDVLRYATLYKFGGIYLDLDVMVLKSLTELKNFAGAESNKSLGSGILGFSADKAGREVALECANELARTFNGKVWGFNGPGVITRVLKKRCKTSSIYRMYSSSSCKGFRVYKPEYFSAFSFDNAQFFFTEGNTEKARALLNFSYTIHVWNKMSSNFVLDNRLDIPYLYYAKKYCPKVYRATNGNF